MDHGYYVKRLKPTFVMFMGIQMAIRLMFVVWEWKNLEIPNVLKAVAVGVLFDVLTFALISIPYLLYLWALPLKQYHTRLDRTLASALFIILSSLLVFDIAAEYAFWEEFSVRFNFIAVDYLIYIDEVLGNIRESYPMGPILLGVATGVTAIYAIARKHIIPSRMPPKHVAIKNKTLIGYLVAILLVQWCVNLYDARVSDNTVANEIAANGIYSLFAAYNNNELDYEKFYLTHDEVGIASDPRPTVKDIVSTKPFAKRNVIFIIMESMSADYMGRYGNQEHLTPVLDNLAAHSLNFSNLYATGTRTVRGLEALTLSIPPAPGDSIVKRPNNSELFSLGYVFKDHGYETKFIYGGYGYFDNMNTFYSGNGFDIVDRNNLADNEIHFANIWGIADEDLFARVIKEARNAYSEHKPFMYMVMTTSNHRPYTFIKNDAGIPTHGGGRKAGVRYADYAIGKFMEQAKKEPWFSNTVFVIVADHTAGASGKTSLPPKRYHIPAMLYSPATIPAKDVPTLASQIDLPVTLLAVLGMDYKSKFFGQNILDKSVRPRAFLATHQQLGIYHDGVVTFVEPVKQFAEEADKQGGLHSPDITAHSATVQEVVTQYEAAAKWKDDYRKLPTTVLERHKE